MIGSWRQNREWFRWASASSSDQTASSPWIEGVKDPIVAARTEVTILRDMGQEAAATEAPLIDEALDLASRLAAAAEAGRVDLNDLGRRARHLLASTTTQDRLV